ncbi:MAG: gliding motility-associated C-terminal domain-containing protein [Bacteroidetes bacterium]|nr:MAG: gliding motility-associated C-terminal domain-containing protein [Bacteroidota bacterium]
MKHIFFCFFLLFQFLFITSLQATHLRAGDLTAQRVSLTGLTYDFILTTYTDDAGVPPDTEVEFFFGDGTPSRKFARVSSVQVNGNTKKNIYIARHTFAGAGEYRVSIAIDFRNDGVINIPNSVNTKLCLESTFLITPFLGLNNSPVLTLAPLDIAAVGQRFFHNPGAVDAEGDSLAYRLVVCKKLPNTAVDTYYELNRIPQVNARNERGDNAATLTMNPYTGDLVWDAPALAGQYNVAFVVEEWRNGVLIGIVNRDMQILVIETRNKRPQLLIPKDTCVIAGTFMLDTITANDPDRNRVRLFSFSELYDLKSPRNKATFDTLSPFPNNRARALFRWRTTCEDVRKQPYTVTFRAEDIPSPNRERLIDIQSWQIRVVAPAPQFTSVSLNSVKRHITLNWNNYICQNASKMTIWRRENSFAFSPNRCQTGLPDGAYTKIGEVDIKQNSFVDTNNDKGLETGKTYCYRIFAVFAQPNGSESIASTEICIKIRPTELFLTNITVNKTDKTTGTIGVVWTRPLAIDSISFPRPYNYQLVRMEGGNYARLPKIFTEKDTTFTDSNLNTEDRIHEYRVLLFSKNVLIDSSLTSSSVRITAKANPNKTIALSWQANTAWANSVADFPKHYIYRGTANQNEDQYDLIDSVNVLQNGFAYTDKGTFKKIALKRDQQYCYFVKTYGKYEDTRIRKPLINKSQRMCAIVTDSIKPRLYLTNVSIEKTDKISGEIFVKWTKPLALDKSYYKMPYTYKISRAEGQTGRTNFRMLSNIFSFTDTSFTDKNLNTNDLTYNYRVYFYAKDSLIDSTAVSTSVRLAANSTGNNVNLTWEAKTAWSNQSAKFKHYIFREKTTANGVFDLIDSVSSQIGFQYTDKSASLVAKQSYCYYVLTQGTYNVDSIAEPLQNKSQKICAVVKDTVSPCPPVLALEKLDCSKFNPAQNCENNNNYTNFLRWTPNRQEPCKKEVKSFKIYFKRFETDEFQLIGTATDTTFQHTKLLQLAGCYAVSVIDDSGNESKKSNIECNDNCPYYALPNVITPNGDGKNDTFKPLNCPRFVEKAIFTVYNRWGEKIYASIDNVNLDWKGVNNNGDLLEGGLYYYEIQLTYIRLKPSTETTVLKGWITIIR